MTISNDSYGETPEISVILATKGDKLELLRNCIKSLKKQTFRNFEIIVVSKRFPKQLADIFEVNNVRFVEENGSTLGAARNLGVNNAKGTLVSFIDDDAEAAPDWLNNISEIFSRFPSLSCLGGPQFTLQNASKKSPLSYVEGLFSEGPRQVSIDKSAIGKIAGCNVTYRKSIFQDLGYLNEKLRTCEDWEFNRRLAEKGYSLRFDPQVWILHHRQGLKHAFKNSSKTAPFFLSWKTFRLSRYDFIIASFYLMNFVTIFLLAVLIVSPFIFVLSFISILAIYIIFIAIRTHTYNREVFYFTLVILFTAARVLGFYFGLVTYASSRKKKINSK